MHICPTHVHVWAVAPRNRVSFIPSNNHDGIWSLGVIADVGSCEPRRYRVKVKEHSNAYGNDYMIVSSASLRPKAKWDSPEWRIRSTKVFHQLIIVYPWSYPRLESTSKLLFLLLRMIASLRYLFKWWLYLSQFSVLISPFCLIEICQEKLFRFWFWLFIRFWLFTRVLHTWWKQWSV